MHKHARTFPSSGGQSYRTIISICTRTGAKLATQANRIRLSVDLTGDPTPPAPRPTTPHKTTVTFSNRGSAHGRGHPGRAEQANANVHVALKLVALHGFCARAFKEQSLNCKPKPFLQTTHLATSRSYATCGTKINLRNRQTNEGTPRKPFVFTNALRESTAHV